MLITKHIISFTFDGDSDKKEKRTGMDTKERAYRLKFDRLF